MTQLQPFQDEATSLALDQLTIENRLDRIEIYGSLQITRDRTGLALARELKALLEVTVKALEDADLPDRLAPAPVERVTNPFK